jgi:drug/metabolite transporter (DMT)-like permease
MTVRGRWLARIAGVFLAADLIVWSHSIADIGAGLGTVITNLQVVIVALLAWLVLRERPRRSLLVALPVMLGGLVLVGGLASTGGYGAHPAMGVASGTGVAALYAVYILMLRQAAVGAPVVATLFEATAGATVAALGLGLLLRDFRLGPAWPALGWLLLLALTSQVVGWLLITVSMPRLPAWLVGAVLLVQPAGSVALGAFFLRERPSAAQLAGVAAMLGGVLIAMRGGPRGRGGPTVQPAAELRALEGFAPLGSTSTPDRAWRELASWVPSAPPLLSCPGPCRRSPSRSTPGWKLVSVSRTSHAPARPSSLCPRWLTRPATTGRRADRAVQVRLS